MQGEEAAIIYTTLPDMEQARELGETLVRERLAACVNMLPGMRSIYEWQGRLEHDEEVVLLAKTTHDGAAVLMRRIAELHPYEVPAILHMPVLAVHPPYLQWMRQALSAGQAREAEDG